MHDPKEPHFASLKRILRYVQGTLELGLHLYAFATTSLVGYTAADWAGCPYTHSGGEGDLDLLRYEDGKSNDGDEDDDGKSDGADDNDVWVWSDLAVSLRSSYDESSPESSGYPYKAGMRFGNGGAGLTESDMMKNGAKTLALGVVEGKGEGRGVVIVL
nr:ribonuclease H-like domain-containing protein [Tanacetum cinerariifolium]